MGHRHTLIPTVGDLGLLHTEWAAGIPGPPRHYQQLAAEFFYVLSGRLDLCTDGEWHALGPRGSFCVKPGVLVEMCNSTDETISLLMGFSPRGFERFIESYGVPAGEPKGFDLSLTEENIRRLVSGCGDYGMRIPELDAPPWRSESPPPELDVCRAELKRSFWLMGNRVRGLDTIGDFGLVEVETMPGLPVPLLHRHDQAAELLYVVEGKLDVFAGDAWHLLSRGESLCIPAGVPHTTAANGDADAVWLAAWTPRGPELLLLEHAIPFDEPDGMERSLSDESLRRLTVRGAEIGTEIVDPRPPAPPSRRRGASRRDRSASPRPGPATDEDHRV